MAIQGCKIETVERLIDMFNQRVLPRVYEMGSLGASGDLAPLAHLSLPLIGLGEAHYLGKIYTGDEILIYWVGNAFTLRRKKD
jgi:histidine ammonia-lyase